MMSVECKGCGLELTDDEIGKQEELCGHCMLEEIAEGGEMSVKEISVGLSGTIPSGAYENLKPSYNMVIDIAPGDDPQKAFNKARAILRDMFELEVNRAKVDLIDKQYGNIRFYEKDGKKYPSVTSILGWDKDWKISEDQLNQYGSRGTIVHKLIEMYLIDGIWMNPEEMPELAEDVAIVLGGSLGLHWDDCSHEAFFEAHGKDIVIDEMEVEVINTEVGYGGRFDAVGTYKDKPAIFDWKTGSVHDFRQLSAYATAWYKATDTALPIETLVIAPVGKTDNKSGVMKPKVSEGLESEYKAFLKARKSFKLRFGI